MERTTKAAKATKKASAKAPKTHRFILDVEVSDHSRKEARLAVLCAFAARAPDGCRFKVHASPPPVVTDELRTDYWHLVAFIAGICEKIDIDPDETTMKVTYKTGGKVVKTTLSDLCLKIAKAME